MNVIKAKKNRIRHLKGFTLVELILAVILISFLGGVVYNIFAQGIQLWNYAVRESSQIDLYLCFEKMTDDIRNALKYSSEKFSGSIDSMQFYSQSTSISRFGPIRVQYVFDRQKKELRRIESDYKVILNSGSDVQETVLAHHVVNCAFSYYYSDQKNSYGWKNAWNDMCFPEAVRVSVDYSEKNVMKNVTKTITLPSGGCTTITI